MEKNAEGLIMNLGTSSAAETLPAAEAPSQSKPKAVGGPFAVPLISSGRVALKHGLLRGSGGKGPSAGHDAFC